MNTIARLFTPVIWLLSLAYPFALYFGRDHMDFAWLAGAMALLWGMRAVLARQASQRWFGCVLAGFFILIVVMQSHAAMYWYPVLMNGLMLLLFGGSLLTEQSMIERFARLRQPNLPPHAVRYTRTVTAWWVVFFIGNGAITIALIVAEAWRAWALYTGVIAYGLMAALLGGEWLYRHLFLAKNLPDEV